jgi:hypothetical protein
VWCSPRPGGGGPSRTACSVGGCSQPLPSWTSAPAAAHPRHHWHRHRYRLVFCDASVEEENDAHAGLHRHEEGRHSESGDGSRRSSPSSPRSPTRSVNHRRMPWPSPAPRTSRRPSTGSTVTCSWERPGASLRRVSHIRPQGSCTCTSDPPGAVCDALTADSLYGRLTTSPPAGTSCVTPSLRPTMRSSTSVSTSSPARA